MGYYILALSYIRQQTHCQWISITNSDNIYGSQVIEQVLSTTLSNNLNHRTVGTTASTGVDMLLMPVDSRSFKHKFTSKSEIVVLLLNNSFYTI